MIGRQARHPPSPWSICPTASPRSPAGNAEAPDDSLRMIAQFFRPSDRGMRPGVSFVSYPVLEGADNDPAPEGVVIFASAM